MFRAFVKTYMNIFSSAPPSTDRKKGFFFHLPARLLPDMIPVPIEAERAGVVGSVGAGAGATYLTTVDRATFFRLERADVLSAAGSRVEEVHIPLLTAHLKRLVQTTTRISRREPGSHAYEKMMGVEAYVTANACADNAAVAWAVARPDGRAFDFVTCSPVQELHLLLWTLGCESLRRAAHSFNSAGNELGADGATTLDGFTHAAMCFEWLTAAAPVQTQAEYSHAGPLHLKSHICRAMELLAVAACHICRAEDVRNEDEVKARATNAVVIVGHLVHAHRNLQEARMRAGNPNGVDDMGIVVLDMLDEMLEYVATWRRAYGALAYLARMESAPSVEYAVIDELNDARAAFGAMGRRKCDAARDECLALLAWVESRATATFALPMLRSVNYYLTEALGSRMIVPLPEAVTLAPETKEHDRMVLFRELKEN